MNYQTFLPPPILSDYVRFFWVLECEISPGSRYIHRSKADGCTELIFHYKGRFDELLPNEKTESSFLSGFHGQSTRFRRFGIGSTFGIFGAYIYPFAIPYLFNTPASEFTDTMTDLSSFLGREGELLEEQMLFANDNHERIRIISQYLQSKLKNHSSKHHVCTSISAIIQKKGQGKIEDLAQQHFFSKRQFERVFKYYAGMSPKLYSRIVRFQSAFSEFNATQPSLTDIAHKCGYYDQSHFIHDFKQFSGFRPSQFLKENSSETIIWTE